MPSLNLDLPQESLDEVARLAQQMNVHRVDVFVRAVSRLSQSLALEKEIAETRDRLAEAEKGISRLDAAIAAEKAIVEELGGALADARRETDAARKAKASLLTEISALRAAAARMAGDQQDLVDQRDDAAARSAEAEERQRKKTLEVIRSEEIGKIRRHAQEISVRAQKLQEELEYRRMDADLRTKKLDAAVRRLQSVSRQKKRFEAEAARQRKELFVSERQIGQLLRDRARLRAELKTLGRLLNRGQTIRPPAKKAARRTGK